MVFRYSFIRLVFSTSFFVLTACVPSTSKIEEPVDIADQTDDLELRSYIERMVADAVKNPNSAAIRGRLAMVYDANSFTDAAIASYRQASLLDSTDMRWPYLTALLYSSQGRINEALVMVDAAIENDARYLPSYFAKGYWLLDLGEYQSACETFEFASTKFPDTENRVPLILGIAQCQLEQNLVGSAVQTIALLPEGELTPYARTVKSRVLRASGQQINEDTGAETSDAAFKDVSWSDPIAGAVVEYTRGFSGESLLARELIDNGRALDALPLIRSLRNRFPNEPSLVELNGAALIELDQRERALTVFEDGARDFPLEHSLYFNIGLLNVTAGKKEQALENFNEAIELDGSFIAAYDAKASLLIDLERIQLARETLQASLKHRDNDADALYLISILFGMDGQWEESVEFLSQVIDLQPTNVDALANMALSLSEIGQFEKALTTVNKARTIAPENAKLQRTVAVLIENGVLVAD